MLKINMNNVFRGYNVSNRGEKIRYIVIHYLGATGTARNNIDYFSSGHRGASADFFVGHSGEIWQYNPNMEGQFSWHCGGGRQTIDGGTFFGICKNSNSIGIEMCCRDMGNDIWKFEKETVDACVELVKFLMEKYDIPAERVIRHYDVNGKWCPQVPGWIPPTGSEVKWLEFKHRIQEKSTVQDEGSLTKIAGTAEATIEQMAAYLTKVNPDTPDSVIEMIHLYISEGKVEGIRGDIAFAQSCLETGNFTFKGSAVTLDQNNFCGLGVTQTGLKGNNFSTPTLGIRAQIQHLKAYANNDPLKQTAVDPRFTLVTRGCAPYVEWLGAKENPKGYGWATGADYGKNILRILKAILETEAGTGECESCKADIPELTAGEDEAQTGGGYMFEPFTVNKGSRGASTKLLQTLLIGSGYKGLDEKALALDGIAGENTMYALKKYQADHGLAVDGICGPATWKSLIDL